MADYTNVPPPRCEDPECPAYSDGLLQHVHQDQAPPQSAPERPALGEFVEVVVRVPIDRHSDAQAIMGVPDDHNYEQIIAWLREEYPSPAGFVADWWDHDGARAALRVRAKNAQGSFEDRYVLWEAGSGTEPAA